MTAFWVGLAIAASLHTCLSVAKILEPTIKKPTGWAVGTTDLPIRYVEKNTREFAVQA